MWKICISLSAPVNNREKGEYRRGAGERSAPPQRRGVGAESAVGLHVAAVQQRLREALAVERRLAGERAHHPRRAARAGRASPGVPIRRERVAQYWTPVPPRGGCRCRLEVFVNLRGFSTAQ
jgi:hypothetical protein